MKKLFLAICLFLIYKSDLFCINAIKSTECVINPTLDSTKVMYLTIKVKYHNNIKRKPAVIKIKAIGMVCIATDEQGRDVLMDLYSIFEIDVKDYEILFKSDKPY